MTTELVSSGLKRRSGLIYHGFIDEHGRLDLNGIWIYGGNPVVIAKSTIFHDTNRYLIGCLVGDFKGYLETLGCPAEFSNYTDLAGFIGKYGERNRKVNRALCSNGDKCALDENKMIKVSQKNLEHMGVSCRTPVVVRHFKNKKYPIEIWKEEDYKSLRAAGLLP